MGTFHRERSTDAARTVQDFQREHRIHSPRPRHLLLHKHGTSSQEIPPSLSQPGWKHA